MKYQTFAVIFIAIILPLSMVLSFYIEMQSDTIALESKYESKLNNATYAAVSAYQMNSLNTQRVAGESILNYVEASVNTFHTTLATSMLQSNASKTLFRPYIPAILFTTYDGYYIYSPYKAAETAIIELDESPDVNILAADNGQTILSSDKEVVYMKDGSSQDYRIKNGGIVNNLRNSKSGSITGDYTTNINQARMDYSYKLKPFIYYSCRYHSGDKDFVASYSLDNYLTLYGKTGSTTFSKAGYGIDPGDVDISGDFLIKLGQRDSTYVSLGSYLTYDNSGSIDLDSVEQYYNDVKNGGSSKAMKFKKVSASDTDEMMKFINDYQYKSGAGEKVGDYYYAQVNNNTYDINAAKTGSGNLTRFQTGDNIIEDTIHLQELFKKHKSGSGFDPESSDPWVNGTITLDGGNWNDITVKYKHLEITDPDAKIYYIKAYYFSKWVQQYLGTIKESDAVQNQGIQEVMATDDAGYYDELTSTTTQVFNFSDANDPSSELSDFFVHKTSVIKNSIQQNLTAAISTFNEDRRVDVNWEYTYRMPVLNSSDWDNILNNVCMVAFMQGIYVGNNRTFNNYAIVKSTNNNTFVTPDNLCFTDEIGVDEEKGDYHKLDCPNLGKKTDPLQELVGDRSAEFKYDALRINSLVPPGIEDDGSNIIAFEDDTTHTFYKAEKREYTDYKNETQEEWVIGDKIDNPNEYILNSHTYNLNSNDDVVTGSLIKYLYDHRNLACYDCIISGNHDSCVKYYDGDLYTTGKTTDTGELLINYKGNWIYPDGNPYTGSHAPSQTILSANGYVNGELDKRRRALFNMLGKYKENQYKSNDYINR